VGLLGDGTTRQKQINAAKLIRGRNAPSHSTVAPVKSHYRKLATTRTYNALSFDVPIYVVPKSDCGKCRNSAGQYLRLEVVGIFLIKKLVVVFSSRRQSGTAYNRARKSTSDASSGVESAWSPDA
jgi:hypothetical protein